MERINVDCPIDGCRYSTSDVPESIAVTLINTHALSHANPTPTAVNARSVGPKLERLKVSMGIALEQWNMFQRRWQVFATGSGISDAIAKHQLFQCTDEILGDAILKVDPGITNKPVDAVLATMKKLVVIPVAIGVVHSELLDLKQMREEPFRSFASRVRGKAETCEFQIDHKCPCGLTNSVDYTDHAMRDVLVAGIYDPDIWRDILGVEGIIAKSVNGAVSLVEGERCPWWRGLRDGQERPGDVR